MDIVLYPQFLNDRLLVEARFVTEVHREIVIQTGYVQMELYPRKNNFPHTVAGLLMRGQLEVECVEGDTPEEAYAKIRERFKDVVEVLQIAELGGSPQPYRNRRAPSRLGRGTVDTRNRTDSVSADKLTAS